MRSMENFSVLDPRKQELLEARLLGNRMSSGSQVQVTQGQHQPVTHHHVLNNSGGGVVSTGNNNSMPSTNNATTPPSTPTLSSSAMATAVMMNANMSSGSMSQTSNSNPTPGLLPTTNNNGLCTSIPLERTSISNVGNSSGVADRLGNCLVNNNANSSSMGVTANNSTTSASAPPPPPPHLPHHHPSVLPQPCTAVPGPQQPTSHPHSNVVNSNYSSACGQGPGTGLPLVLTANVHPSNQDSNMSAGSSHSDKEVETPEKPVTKVPGPERKRKRKADDGGGAAATSGPSIGSGSVAGGSNKPTKKINDYFSSKIAGGSPNRHQHGGAKSPSPHPAVKPIFPASPQNVSSSTTGIDRGAALSSDRNVTRLAGPTEPLPVVSSSSVAVVQVIEQQEGPCLVAGGTSSVNSVVAVVNSIHKAVQTELTGVRLAENEAQATADVEMRDSRIEELNRSSEDLRQQLTNHQRLIEQQKAHINKCIDVVKKLLIEKSTIERKEARQRCMQNRLKLGQFVTQRVGATFQENWTDGYAFQELTRRQEEISNEKEDIDRQRKLLGKRRPTMTEGQGRKGRGVVNGTSDGFAKPEAVREMTWQEYYETDEIYKLRQNALKKEDADLQLEMEKLERERNLHIRELKRILNEDQSRFNNHTVLNDRYLLLMLLGKGGFSEVHKAFDLKEQRYVACKVHQLNKDWKDDKKANYIKHALREYNIHKQLDHPRVVKLYDVFEIDANSFCTVLEYCDGHDLDFYLKQHKTIPEREARSVIMQVVSALKYLNEIKPPIIHYDLKPGNILLTEGNVCGEIKITDFGLSKVMDEDNYNPEHGMDLTSQGAGTYWYLPPECFVVGKTPPKISSKVDVWSVGVIFYQCLYGKKPFGHNQSQATILEENTILKATEVQFPNKPTVSPEAKQLIRQCLAYRKEDRLDVMQLARSEYLQPPIPRYARQNAAAAAAAAASHVGSTSSSQSLSQQPTTPTGNNPGFPQTFLSGMNASSSS
ncbi:unnamed protein product [Orchesella dallaii]|uniref:Protein kinase domain-containing protein n=1 Tax=Orchesella dallaii TaxID=48710 RepID=A0ABP1PQK3_9HEXA